jgi:hypothetical protein
MIEIPYLKDFLKSIKKAAIDDFVDRLNYYYTASMLIFFAIVTGAKQTFGKPIECMMPAEYPSTWSDYVREFCYVSSTYFVPVNETSTIAFKKEHMAHGYYQWVPFILILQAILIYLPNLGWKTFQRSQTIDFRHIVEQAKSLRFVMGEEHEKGIKDIVTYLKERLQHQGTKNGFSYVGFGMKSSLLHIFAKILTIAVIITELSFMNKTFGNGKDTYWGVTMFNNGLTNTRWSETGVFPRITFCDFKQPILGNNYPERTVQCVLMINMINEKIFIFIWLWLAALLVISLINIVFTIATLFIPDLRRISIGSYVQPPASSGNHTISTTSSYMSDEDKLMNFAAAILGADGVHLFDFIKAHAGTLIAVEIATAFFDSLYNEATQPPSRFDNDIHTFGEKQGKSHC